MRVAVFGATAGMGRAVARALASQGHGLFVLGIGAEELDRSARDLEVRGAWNGKVGWAVCDLARPDTFAPALDAAREALGDLDAVVVTAAVFGTQEQLEDDVERARVLLTLNFAHTVVFCEHARKLLLARGGGTLVVFSSVAGDRGRKPVALYGSTKAGLSHYLESLDHRFYARGLRVVTVKPGFVKTGMTAGLKPPPFAGEPEQVADDVVRAMVRFRPVVYSPAIWRWILLVIRLLPRFVMRRINF